MRLDLADRLRCPRTHAPSPLVVVARKVEGRELLSGFAGCPVCQLEARIEGAVIRFPDGPNEASRGARGATADTVRSESSWTAQDPPGSSADARVGDESLTRLAALMGLDEPGGVVLLTGSYAKFAARMTDELEVSVVVMGAPPEAGAAVTPGVCFVELSQPAVPFADQTFRAAALDDVRMPDIDAPGSVVFIADALRSVTVGGRVVGTAATPLPDDVKELARDEREWVGERQVAASRVTLGRARS